MNTENPFQYSTAGANQENNLEQKPIIKNFISIIQFIVLLAAIGVVLYLFFIIPTQVSGKSMFPNFHDNDILLTNRLIQISGGPNGLFKGYNYQRGDVVVFFRKGEPDLIKRIIGLPGETVMINNNKIYINGQELIEKYIDSTEKPTEPGTFIAENETKQVPTNSYFCLGDNRTNSIDSRDAQVGFVKRKQLKGLVFIQIIRMDEMGENGKFNLKFISKPDYNLSTNI